MAYENENVAKFNMCLNMAIDDLNQEIQNERDRHQVEINRLQAIVAETTNDNEKLASFILFFGLKICSKSWEKQPKKSKSLLTKISMSIPKCRHRHHF